MQAEFMDIANEVNLKEKLALLQDLEEAKEKAPERCAGQVV